MKSVYSVISNTNLHHYPLNTKKYSFFTIKKTEQDYIMKTLKKVGIKGEMFIMPWALYDKEEKPRMSFALLLSVFLRGNYP